MHLLHNLFTTIWITEVIAAEIGLFATDPAPHEFPGSRLLAEAGDRGWLRIAHSQIGQEDGDSPYIPLNPGVAPGEASAIGARAGQRQPDIQSVASIPASKLWRVAPSPARC